MVNLTRIYTRTGDEGTTALGDFSRTAKTDVRLQAYADANEANAVIGVAIATRELSEEVVTTLTSATGSRIQLDQAVTRDGETLFQSTVTLVCVDIRVMRAHRMPPALIGALGG